MPNITTIKSWADADKLMGKRHIKGVGNKTYLCRLSDDPGTPIRVMYNEVPIVTYFKNGNIKLSTGGHYGSTTKSRLNQFTPFYIQQVRGVWFITVGKPNGADIIVAFKDNMIVTPEGNIEGGMSLDELAQQNEFRREILAYADAWAIEFVDGKLKDMSGDCFECQAAAGLLPQDAIRSAKVVNGQIVTEPTNSPEHYRQHIKEKYYMGTLAIQAFHPTKTNHAYLAAAEQFLRGAKAEKQSRDMYVREFSKMVYRFLCEKLGVAR